ncbi:MAG: AzlD domain-containing protein [Erysipelotrichaceae bacterium]|nr:AzlD domain-containing protein [Erysipelotrichaceae bacterium]
MRITLSIMTMALVTYAIRALSLTLVRKKITNRFIRSLLYYLPYAVLAAMSFPAILYCCEKPAAALCGTAVALVLSFLEKPLTTVAIISALAVLTVSIIL